MNKILFAFEMIILIVLVSLYPLIGVYKVLIVKEWTPEESYDYIKKFYSQYLVLFTIFFFLIWLISFWKSGNALLTAVSGPLVGISAGLLAILFLNNALFLSIMVFIESGVISIIKFVMPTFEGHSIFAPFENETANVTTQFNNTTSIQDDISSAVDNVSNADVGGFFERIKEKVQDLISGIPDIDI